MKKNLLFFLTRIIIPGIIALVILSLGFKYINRGKRSDDDKRKKHEIMLNRLQRQAPLPGKTGKEEPAAADQPDMAAFHEFLATFDPATGTVPRERLLPALEKTRQLTSLRQGTPIIWQGYQADMGGRTRAIMYDPNDPLLRKVWAGGVTGGIWYNNNITNAQSPWIPVGDSWNNMAIRCMTYDPQNTQIFYVGTGEVETAMQTYRESSGLGFGIGRSDDGGQTWYHIPGTEQFAYVTDIVIRVESGISVIYAGVASGLYKGSQHQSMPSDGLFRSADGGATWQQVLPLITGSTVPYCVSDIALGTNNRLYVGTRPNLDGEGAAVILISDDGLQWQVNDDYQAEILASPENNIPGRVVLATAPSDSNIVYALIASGYVNPANGFNYFNCYHILRSANQGNSWAKKSLPSDLTSGNNFATIAWHALDIGVDQNNPGRIFVGGLDVHSSPNGGSSWKRVSDWSLMYSGGGPEYIHADQHTIVFKPGSSTEALFGSDGGIFYTANALNTSPVFEEHNKDYNTLQFYTCAIHPEAGNESFYGGLQDNGSLLYNGSPLTILNMVSGGDGACCFYDELDPSLSITSHYYNNYYIYVNGNFQNSVGDYQSGTFVSPADFDYNQKYLFCNAVDYIGTHADQILRLKNLTNNTSGNFLSLNTGSTVFFSALRFSPYSTEGKSTLFVGSESGRLFRVAEAQSNSPVVTEIGNMAFPTASISSIAIGKSEDTLVVTFSNYGVTSVWRTFNGGLYWKSIEGNLPDMPVRWALMHPQNNLHALLATETGVWQCTDISQDSPVWVPVNTGMANVRVDMLQLRKSDNLVLAATHGRGLFSMTWDLSTGINPAVSGGLGIYPNPSTGRLMIELSKAWNGPAMLSVTDLQGKVLHRESLVLQGPLRKQVDLHGAGPGVYMVRIATDGGKTWSGKVVID